MAWTLGQRVVLSSHFTAAENVEDPAQILIGVTALGPDAEKVQADWRDGTLAEYALMPATAVTPAEGPSHIDSAQLAVLMRYIVPFGGLFTWPARGGRDACGDGRNLAPTAAAPCCLRSRWAPDCVVAAGRNSAAVDAVARAGGARVVPVALTGDIQADASTLRAAANGGAQMAFDMVGGAGDPNAYRRLLDLVCAGLLDISAIRPRVPAERTAGSNGGSGHSGQPRMRCGPAIAARRPR